MGSAIQRRAWLVAFFVSSFAVGLTAVSLGASRGVTPAAPGEPTYQLSSIRVAQPSEDEALHWGEGAISVKFDADWTGTDYPGRSTCEVTVLDSKEAVIGSKQFEFGAYQSHTTASIVLNVNGTAVSATAVCSAAERPPAEAGYVISEPKIQGTADDPRLVFDVAWNTSDPPLLQSCLAVFSSKDGATNLYSFEMSLPEGQATVLLTAELFDATPVSVECRPI